MWTWFRFAVLFMFVSAVPSAILAQNTDPIYGGERPAHAKMLKGKTPGTFAVRHFPVATRNAVRMKTTAGVKSDDIGQISTFPFQEPLSNGSSYYEACPFALANGNLFVLYASPMGDSLFYSTSSDSGMKWSTPVFAFLSDLYCSDLVGLNIDSGRLIAVWQNYSSGLVERYSDDGGVTWSSPISISGSLLDNYATLSRTLDGRIWLCYSRANVGGPRRLYYKTSGDSGATWSAEKSFGGPASAYTVYGGVVSKDSATILLVYEDNSGGPYGIYEKSSSDSGVSWSSPVAIVAPAIYGSEAVRPRVLRQVDGTLWLVYQQYSEVGQSGFSQSDIHYVKSTDGGENWSRATSFTAYAGYDGWFNACLAGDRPFVTFASHRWTMWYGQTHLWYGIVGISQDVDTPPAVVSYSPQKAIADSIIYVQAVVDGQSEIMDVTLDYSCLHAGTWSTGSAEMYDDGLHRDGLPGDKVYGAGIGPFQLGDELFPAITVTDANSNDVSVGLQYMSIPAVHNAGNMVLEIGGNSELGNTNLTLGTSAYWPKENGFDYLCDGGLWAGCKIGGVNTVLTQEYRMTNDWNNLTQISVVSGPSDQTYDVSYQDEFASSPIGLRVHQESYQWSDTTRDDFIIFKYTITNRGINGNLDNIYVALWLDPDVSVETNPMDNRVGYDTKRGLLYISNASGNPDGYFGVRLLGGSEAPTTVLAYAAGLDPSTTDAHYQFMTRGDVAVPDSTADYRLLLTAPAFSLPAGGSDSLAFGIVLGHGLSQLQANADTMESVYEKNFLTAVYPVNSVSSNIPKEFRLLQNYPNPFNPTTTIGYEVPRSGIVSLKVYDVLGREVGSLVDELRKPGKYAVRFDASALPSGVYFYRIVVNSPQHASIYNETKKLMVVK